MSAEKTFISLGDFLDIYNKAREKGLIFLFSKFKLLSSSRIASKWGNYKSNSDFWLIPKIEERWNILISGDKNLFYEDYVVEKHFKEKSGLKMLSIGCGEGSHEMNFAKHSCFSEIIAIDFAKEVTERAQKKADENNYPIKFISGDFKKVQFKKEYFDVIHFSSSLHHFEEIEDTLKSFVQPLMKRDALLVVFEYCGPNRLQWTREQLNKSNQLLKQLPKKYKLLFDGLNIKRKVYRPGILRMFLVDPSEAPDSISIVPALQNNFEVVQHVNLGWNLLHILLKGISHNFINDNPETIEILNQLIAEEDLFVKQTNKSDAIFGIYRLK